MSLIAEAYVDSPLFADALAAAPDVVLQLEDIRLHSGGPIRFLFWAEGGDHRALEEGLAEDDTVESYRHLAESDGGHLYRLTLSERGESLSTYPAAVEQDIVIVELRFTTAGMHALGRVPDRDALVAYREACTERGFDFRLERVYREDVAHEDGGVDHRFGVTRPQREALRTALEMGYFDVPRAVSLEQVAEELGISRQALSTRLRRGHSNLVRNTLS